MTFKTTIHPSNHSFEIKAEETIIDAALAHGYTLPHSCRNGACGVCKGKILQGTVDYGDYQGHALTDAEKAAGMALFCRAKPKSDLIIESLEVTTGNEIQVKTLPCRVQS